MAKLLALEWDAREARVVVARRRGRSAVIEQAFAIRYGGDVAGAEPTSGSPETRLGNLLASRLSEHGAKRAETMVAVGRANIELRLLSLPPAPPEELPDLVRFQAQKQFSSVGDNWPIDFVPLASDQPGSLSVLAAAISPELVEQIRRTCAAAQLDPQRLVLRPFAAASHYQRHAQSTGCVLIVDLLTEDADLTVLVDGQVRFVRTMRLPTGLDPEAQARWLVAEARRTSAAASNQLGGRRVERVVLCGDSDDYIALQKVIDEQAQLPVSFYNPFDGVAVDRDLVVPSHSGRFAPLLGMITEAAANEQSGIDFLNPRKPPKPPDQRRKAGFIAAAVAAAVLGVGYLVWSQTAELDEQIADLKQESATLDQQLKKYDEPLRDVADVDAFTGGDYNWLDELAHLSDKFLSADAARVNQLSGVVQNDGGHILVEGHLKQSSDIDELENRLRDADHRVAGTGTQYDAREKQFPWQFRESVYVSRSALLALTDGSTTSKESADEKATVEGASESRGGATKPAEKPASDKPATDKAEDRPPPELKPTPADERVADRPDGDKSSAAPKVTPAATNSSSSNSPTVTPATAKPPAVTAPATKSEGASNEPETKPGDAKSVDDNKAADSTWVESVPAAGKDSESTSDGAKDGASTDTPAISKPGRDEGGRS